MSHARPRPSRRGGPAGPPRQRILPRRPMQTNGDTWNPIPAEAARARGADGPCPERVAAAPGDPRAWALLGAAFLGRGRPGDALAPLGEALRQAAAHDNLGVALARLGRAG